MKTLAELIEAYKNGEITQPMTLDNDSVSVDIDTGEWEPIPGTTYRREVPFFEAHPQDLLEQLLDYVGIPHEHV